MRKSLAVKYRPQKFEDVVEQTVTKAILMEQLKEKTFGHAYLFNGTTGCGKTTCARIFAKEINAELVELDAASHTGIEDVKMVIEQARLKPIIGEYKVFILDECHSFSSKAWQALLKLLEDTPAFSILILCTTDPQKVPNTVLNRVQQLHFGNVSIPSIVERLQYITDEEKIEIDKESLFYIAGMAKGSMRTAISLLEKALVRSSKLTVEQTVKELGVVSYDTYFQFLNSLTTFNNGRAIRIIAESRADGVDSKTLLDNFTSFVIECIKIKACQDWCVSTLPYQQKYVELLRDEDLIGLREVLNFCKKCLQDIRDFSDDPKKIIEMNLLLRG